jgi:peptide-methionine (S)-S-oxide reductase
MFAERLRGKGFGTITTEIAPAGGIHAAADDGVAGPFYYAEGYHQQYLYKNPNGYCPVHSTGVACPVPAT